MLMRKLIKNRKGTAEVIGTIMFIVILLFFFTNVYLWHDAATKDANEMYVKKMNAGMNLNYDSDGNPVVTATGSDAVLSRLWIVTSNSHLYANLERLNVHMMAGENITIRYGAEGLNSDGSINAVFDQNNKILMVSYPSQNIVQLSLINTLGISVTFKAHV
jgi:hypothetical protein